MPEVNCRNRTKTENRPLSSMKNNRIVFRSVLVTAVAILAAINIFLLADWNKNVDKVPPVGKGNVAVFYAEMSGSMRISDIATTEQYIYFAYSTPGVVAVYDWNGQYQCSYAFYRGTNGVLGIGCENEMLYVHDYAGYEFVFSGIDNVAVYDSENSLHMSGWFHRNDAITVVVDKGNVYDLSGNFIMSVPGRLK